ncbi:phosphate signaling complex protein PhoU [Alkalimarinus sediminis]|uniref:Phosphate-specific transport system accessory protein PhoU n=1 Tax=Alkalimarinus sediminis TaxID=1632866 RepID=A0A9E8KN35_9ALTE|nr:phosphate signaling complex protein PhoU [Alkalimarinus sediminis]UZW74003.1 phosphate signaling complex protein PhoU [Alkalimarinus sediminis]
MGVTTKDSHKQHISQQFNAELSELKNHLLVMGGVVEKQVSEAVEALVKGDGGLADSVLNRDEDVNRLELMIDEECTQVIAKRQPTASDLRLVMSVAKMVSDLERMGDEASKVAKMALKLSEEGEAPRGYVEVRHMGENVSRMVRDALDCFARFDTEKAIAVIKEDKSVDNEYRTATRSLVTFMMEDPRSISRILSVMWVLRALERIGDHACNIAEHVIYMVKGKDVRHISVELAEKAIEGRR